MITIAVQAYNQVEFTKMCVESILKYTNTPYKLILIDNGSTDGTLLYFQKVARMHDLTEIIHYDENRIVEEIANEYLSKVDTEFFIGVTNDTIVHNGWAENLIDCLKSSDDVGMVGPRANNISGKQMLYPGAYRSLDEYHIVADKWSTEHKGEYFEISRVVGMLAAMRMEAYRKTQGYDVNLPTNGKDGGYGFSDDDLSAKMIKAGYRLLITNDVFIHHFGGVTVGNYTNGIMKNKEQYERTLNASH
jgi:GT2 family glycosyltransferase